MPATATPIDKENFPDYTSKFSLTSFKEGDKIFEQIIELEARDLLNDAKLGEDK